MTASERTNELTVSLPDDVADRLRAGNVDDVSSYVGEAVAGQVRQAAIRDYLDACEQAGHQPLNGDDLREFRRMVGEEQA